MVSGIAASIRSSLESSSFDLAGHDASSIKSIISDAFSADFPAANFTTEHSKDGGGSTPQMIRITFLVGAGKKESRNRYDAQAARIVTSTLSSVCGYVEDHAASCLWECGGSYKLQHDTGKNQKTVVVFPRVAGAEGQFGGPPGEDGMEEGMAADAGEEEEPLIPLDSPGYKLAISSLDAFPSLISAYCPTYLQKRSCLQCLESLVEVEQSLEQKMMHGNALDAGEKTFYDAARGLPEKVAQVQKEMSAHVDQGRLSIQEKNLLLELNAKRIKILKKDGSSDKLEKALARKNQLESLTDDILNLQTSYPPPLRHEAKITALRKKLLPLKKLEESSKGRLLTLSETKALSDKLDIETHIAKLEEASRGWFEQEEDFEKRVSGSRQRFEAKHMRKSTKSRNSASSYAKAAGKGGAQGGKNTKWILPGEKQKDEKNAWASPLKKKWKGKGGAVFSAMMMDSSSEEEDAHGDDNDSLEEDNCDFDVYEPNLVEHDDMIPPTKVINTTTSTEKVTPLDAVPASFNKATTSPSTSTTPAASPTKDSTTTTTSPQYFDSPDTAAGPSVPSQKKKSKKKNRKSKRRTKQPHEDDWDYPDNYHMDNSTNTYTINAIDENENTSVPTPIKPKPYHELPDGRPLSPTRSFYEFLKTSLIPLLINFVLLAVSMMAHFITGCISLVTGKKARKKPLSRPGLNNAYAAGYNSGFRTAKMAGMSKKKKYQRDSCRF